MLRRLLRLLFGAPDATGPQSPPARSDSVGYADDSAPADSTEPDSSLSGLDASCFAPRAASRVLSPENPSDLAAAADGFPIRPEDASWPDADTVDRTLVHRGLTTREELRQLRAAISVKQASSATASADVPRRSRREIHEVAGRLRTARRRAADQRRQSDIWYLGRGVSRGLADRNADTQRLSAAGIPQLATPADLAAALQISIPRLRWLAYHSEAVTRPHYYTFEIPRKSGGTRTLAAPHFTMAMVQGWILDEILCRLPVHPSAHGFVPGRSVVTNARPHVGARVVINADLADFFPSITFPRVAGLFRSLGYSPAVATILALLCTECPRQPLRFDGTEYFAAIGPRALPQGACTSPAISNFVVWRLDRRLDGLARRLGWSYTRYADDLTLSTVAEPSPSTGYVLARLRHIAEDEGFTLNDGKTHVQRPSQRQTVTGVTINDRLNVPRTTVRRIRAILHNAQFTGLEAQNRDDHPHFTDWLLGTIGWITMVHPDAGRKLREQLREVTSD